MTQTAAEVTEEYVKQIVKAVNDMGDDATYLVTDLLKEYGAKAYRAGKEELAAAVAKMV